MKFKGNRAKAVQLLAIPDSFRSYEKVAKELGVSRQTLFVWRQEPDFQAEVIKRSQEWMGDDFPVIVAAHIVKCKMGDMVAIKEYYDRVLGKVIAPVDINLHGNLSMTNIADAIMGNYEEREDGA